MLIKRDQEFWDDYFLGIAKKISEASKDPAAQVGAVLIDDKRKIVSTGYNGFPRRCIDSEEFYNDREIKLLRVLHAEENAVLEAERPFSTAYVTRAPCAHCTAVLIQKDVKRIVFFSEKTNPSWEKSFAEARRMAWEAHVELVEYGNE